MNEIWKDIKNYEGLYQVSNLGRIKSLGRNKTAGKGNYKRNEKILRQYISKGKKSTILYKTVVLCKNGLEKRKLVHRLVADTFLLNKNKNLYVNHKDGNGFNNNLDNLEYTTNSQNQKYSLYTLRTTKNVKSVIAINKKDKNIKMKFYSIGLASKFLLENNYTKDKTCGTGIIKSCKKKIPSYLGFIWYYESEVENNAKIK